MRIAELYDPTGIHEPIKLQQKLHLSKLNGRDWKEPLPPEEKVLWKTLLFEFVEFHRLWVPRCVFQPGSGDGDIRLVCFADAAVVAGGAAVYAGVELTPGCYSSALIAAKSRLIKGTVPRNELSAIMLMTELAFMVKRALGEQAKEVVYISDSIIALSWFFSLKKKLHLFV